MTRSYNLKVHISSFISIEMSRAGMWSFATFTRVWKSIMATSRTSAHVYRGNHQLWDPRCVSIFLTCCTWRRGGETNYLVKELDLVKGTGKGWTLPPLQTRPPSRTTWIHIPNRLVHDGRPQTVIVSHVLLEKVSPYGQTLSECMSQRGTRDRRDWACCLWYCWSWLRGAQLPMTMKINNQNRREIRIDKKE